MTYATREEWLTAAIEQMTDWFADISVTIPKNRVSCAWSKRSSKNAIAWCWETKASTDGVNELQVSPEIDDPFKVLEALTHELIHASDDCYSKHSGYFRTTALAIGLTGKMTATQAGETLTGRILSLITELGAYPHSAINPLARTTTKQTTRMIKVECPEDGYTVRTTRKWIEVGVPTCPCGQLMIVADPMPEQPEGE